MSFLPVPYERFEYRSPLPPGLFLDRLRGSIERDWWPFWDLGTPLPFVGRVKGDRFRVRRKIRGGNPIMPRIKGRVFQAPDGGSLVTGSMKMNMFFGAHMGLFCLLCLIGSIGALWQYSDMRFLLPMAMGLLYYVPVTGYFTFEANKARAILAEISGTKPKPQPRDALDT